MEPLIGQIFKEFIAALVRRAAWIMLFASLLVGIGAFTGGYWMGKRSNAEHKFYEKSK